ncbi:hypothetical protein [Aliterella atlantica]|nr:hypothetical protein [Aliterella atlantica]
MGFGVQDYQGSAANADRVMNFSCTHGDRLYTSIDISVLIL